MQPASRAPVVVLIAGTILAAVLVFAGARLAARPAPSPDLNQPGTPDNPRAVTVIMRDYLFNPSLIYLVAGETVEFTIFNAGLVEHELVLGDEQVQQAWRAADQVTPPAVGATAPPASPAVGTGGLRVLLEPGQSAAVRYTVPIRGRIQAICHLPGHEQRGMVAEVALVNR